MLTLTLIVGLVMVGAVEANAATSGKLIKSITRYYKNNGKWEKMETIKFTYNDRKEPILIESEFRTNMKNFNTATQYTKLEYTYKDGKKVKRVDTTWYDDEEDYKNYPVYTLKYDSKGRVKSSVREEEEGDFVTKDKFTYGKNGYFKTATNTYMEEGYIKYRYEWNGKKPKKIIGTRHRDGDKYRTVENTFNKKGLLETHRLFISGGGTTTYKYTYKNGLIKTINSKAKNGNNITLQKYKITYYSDKKISSSRYRAMINNQLLEPLEVGNFWY